MRTGQIVQFPLSRGLDEDGNPKSHAVSTLKRGDNIRWPKEGTIGKRFGTRSLGGFGPVTRFVPRGAELAAVSSGSMRVYNPISDGLSAVTSTVPAVELGWSTLVDDEAGVAVADAALSGDLLVQAWVTGDPTRLVEATPIPRGARDAYVQIVNRKTKEVLLEPGLIASDVDHLRVFITGGYAFVVFSTDTSIKALHIDMATLGFSASNVATLKTDRVVVGVHGKNGRFDCILRGNGDVVLAYERNTSGSSKLACVRFTLSGPVFTPATDVAQSDGTFLDAKALAIAEDTGGAQIFVIYSKNVSTAHSVKLCSVDSTSMAAAGAITAIRTSFYASQVDVFATGAGIALAAWSGFGIGGNRLPVLITQSWNCASGGVSAVAHTIRESMGLALLSRIGTLTLGQLATPHFFACDGRDGEDDGDINFRTTFPSTFLLSVPTESYSSTITGSPPHALQGKVDHDIGGMVQGGCLPHICAVDAKTVLGLLPFQADAAEESWNWRCGLRLVTATVDLTQIADPFHSVSIGEETYIKGGFLGAWDGASVFDYGMRAPILIVANDLPNGGFVGNGSYIYQFEPGYRSRASVLHRGPLSDTVDVNIEDGPLASVVIKLCSHGIDGKQTEATGFANRSGGRAFLNAFRTEANGSILHQLTMGPRYNTFPNDPTAETIDFTDTRWDNDIGGQSTESPSPEPILLGSRPQPYTASGELEDCQPPAQYSIHLHNGRIFLILGDRRTVWYSKDYRENPGIAPGFNPDQVEIYEHDLTGIESLDDKRIMFWERGLWYVVGDGPTVSGTDNRFSSPQIIQSNVGCSNPRSLVSTPMGVFFQSGVQLYLLGRNLVVEQVSRPVEDTLAAYQQITSAVLVSAQNEVRFTCNTADGTQGLLLVFDYQRGTWFTRTYPGAGPLRDAVLHQGRYYMATGGLPSGPVDAVRYEDTTVHYDDLPSGATFAPSTVELEEIEPAGTVGWQRVRVVKPIGTSLTHHALSVAVSRDFAASYEQTESFPAGSDVTTPGTYLRCEVAPTVQRRQAIGIKLSDAAAANTAVYPIGNGAGFQLEGIALLVQPKPGLPRDTSSRRGG